MYRSQAQNNYITIIKQLNMLKIKLINTLYDYTHQGLKILYKHNNY